jgi:hypothetical protein
MILSLGSGERVKHGIERLSGGQIVSFSFPVTTSALTY